MCSKSERFSAAAALKRSARYWATRNWAARDREQPTLVTLSLYNLCKNRKVENAQKLNKNIQVMLFSCQSFCSVELQNTNGIKLWRQLGSIEKRDWAKVNTARRVGALKCVGFCHIPVGLYPRGLLSGYRLVTLLNCHRIVNTFHAVQQEMASFQDRTGVVDLEVDRVPHAFIRYAQTPASWHRTRTFLHKTSCMASCRNSQLLPGYETDDE